jgi:hypothetical protein
LLLDAVKPLLKTVYSRRLTGDLHLQVANHAHGHARREFALQGRYPHIADVRAYSLLTVLKRFLSAPESTKFFQN